MTDEGKDDINEVKGSELVSMDIKKLRPSSDNVDEQPTIDQVR
jgi:hypothetical protein